MAWSVNLAHWCLFRHEPPKPSRSARDQWRLVGSKPGRPLVVSEITEVSETSEVSEISEVSETSEVLETSDVSMLTGTGDTL